MNSFQKIEKFCNENPTNAAVKSLNRLLNKPLSMNGSLGKRFAEVQKMAEEAYG